MTVEEARKILGVEYQKETDERIQIYVDAAMGLSEVFFQQFKDNLMQKKIPLDKFYKK